MGYTDININSKIYIDFCLKHAPRVLSSLDRNFLSNTAGCADWRWWHDKVIDIPSGHDQEMIYFLALLYVTEYSKNPYYKNETILGYIRSGIKFWSNMTGKKGYLDEFYPNERGWAGPTGFLLYTMIDSYRMLKEEIPNKLQEKFLRTCHQAARYLVKYDELGVLANHHAMAILAIRKAYEALNEKDLLDGFKRKWAEFLKYHYQEGWSLEYDGVDPGYLSATVSFFRKDL